MVGVKDIEMDEKKTVTVKPKNSGVKRKKTFFCNPGFVVRAFH